MDAEVKITCKIGNQTLELTPEEAKKLLEVLNKVLNKDGNYNGPG